MDDSHSKQLNSYPTYCIFLEIDFALAKSKLAAYVLILTTTKFLILPLSAKLRYSYLVYARIWSLELHYLKSS